MASLPVVATPVTNVTASSSFHASDTVSIVVPANGSGDQPTVYVFDGVVRIGHRRAVTPADFPIQNSAPITDHLCVQPFELVLDVRVSDAMVKLGMSDVWGGNFARSVNAYSTLLGFQGAYLVTINTRLNQYENMALLDIRTDEDEKTSFNLKASLTFRQILTATVVTDSGVTQGNSARPLPTDPVATTVKQPTTPTPSVSGMLFGSFGTVSAPAPGQ